MQTRKGGTGFYQIIWFMVGLVMLSMGAVTIWGAMHPTQVFGAPCRTPEECYSTDMYLEHFEFCSGEMVKKDDTYRCFPDYLCVSGKIYVCDCCCQSVSGDKYISLGAFTTNMKGGWWYFYVTKIFFGKEWLCVCLQETSTGYVGGNQVSITDHDCRWVEPETDFPVTWPIGREDCNGGWNTP